ncbi:MAG TPA: SUMF1/EgtB/PvdO family nonheme iron enzyme [Myxococcota bacterium]|nr:SUMF1/EgtB/PvdO family nonheme iron enzyme [Myxococcota bacterium]HRY92166.1 SUMF1/EgtB/PvdO family nonheme iron enzyme [Myxococcota bacterium]HSA20642.1 SUMF1/EgtB/PvdO family nonheme iron enzyme [Myxococcota bacterium]
MPRRALLLLPGLLAAAWLLAAGCDPADPGQDAHDGGDDGGEDAGDGAPDADDGAREDVGGDETADLEDAPCTGEEVPQPNAGLEEPPGLGGCPAGMAPVPGGSACIDRWEAFLEELSADGPGPRSPYFNPGAARVVARSAPGAVPQGYVSRLQAGQACAEAGKRLCTRAEWELACRGSEGRTYPYGNTRQDGLCNDARAVHPAVEYFGTSAAWIWSELDHPCLNQLADGLAPAGAHPGCATPEGVLDLMGNLHEWVDDPAGTFKGGYYVDTRLNGEGCLYTTTAHPAGYWDYSTGFRCCAEHL